MGSEIKAGARVCEGWRTAEWMQARHAGARHCDPESGKGNPGSGCRLTSVTVMQSAQPRQGDEVALVWRFDGSGERTILFQRPVRTITMIIAQVVRENAAQVFFVENDDVIQAFPADGADQAFDHRILPR